MGPLCHLGVTSALLAGSKLAGVNLSPEVIAMTYLGGVLIDGDKVFEIYHRNVRKLPPDITARDRILHSVFAFPFAALLTLLSSSLLPAIAVLLHIMADSFVPGLLRDGRHYPSHPRRKWISLPFAEQFWYQFVPRGWPIQYPPKLNSFYKLAEPVGLVLTLLACLTLFY